MNVIGFANKFYTLWDLQEEKVFFNAPNGNSYPSHMKYHYSYLKNISMDVNKVKSLYPTTQVDYDLRGTSDFFREKKENDLSPEILKFGKYNGWNVNELVKFDFDYVLWFMDNLLGNNLTRNIIKETPEYIQYLKLEQERIQTMIDSIKPLNSGTFKFLLSTNPDEDGFCHYDIAQNHTLRLKFPEVQPFLYNDIRYFLPVFDGKAKRVKGKELSYLINITNTEISQFGSCIQEADIIIINNELKVYNIEAIKDEFKNAGVKWNELSVVNQTKLLSGKETNELTVKNHEGFDFQAKLSIKRNDDNLVSLIVNPVQAEQKVSQGIKM